MTLKEQRLSMLPNQMKGAAVTKLEDGFYQVFVPNAVREDNTVKAKNKAEALAKVEALLQTKIEQYAETSTGHVVIQPRSLK